MNILLISDTHCQHNRLDKYLKNPEFIKDVDVIIHSGDASDTKSKAINCNEMHSFLEWYSDLNIPTKIFTPGNHDVSIEAGMIKPSAYPNINFLIDDGLTIQNTNFYGSPLTPTFGMGWAYNVARHKLYDYWQNIPATTNLLITHGPPKGILDLTHRTGNIFESVGCKSLLTRTFELDNLQYHVFGHIHDEKNIINSGYRIINDIIYINASICNLSGLPVNKPIKIVL